MNCTRLIGIAVFSLSLLLPSQGISGEIYTLHMKEGRDMKCLSVKRAGSSIICDADGLEIAVDTSTVEKMTKSKGQLTKYSSRSRTVAGKRTPQKQTSGDNSHKSTFSPDQPTTSFTPDMVRNEREALRIKYEERLRSCTKGSKSSQRSKCVVKTRSKWDTALGLLKGNPSLYFSNKYGNRATSSRQGSPSNSGGQGHHHPEIQGHVWEIVELSRVCVLLIAEVTGDVSVTVHQPKVDVSLDVLVDMLNYPLPSEQ